MCTCRPKRAPQSPGFGQRWRQHTLHGTSTLVCPTAQVSQAQGRRQLSWGNWATRVGVNAHVSPPMECDLQGQVLGGTWGRTSTFLKLDTVAVLGHGNLCAAAPQPQASGRTRSTRPLPLVLLVCCGCWCLGRVLASAPGSLLWGGSTYSCRG